MCEKGTAPPRLIDQASVQSTYHHFLSPLLLVLLFNMVDQHLITSYGENRSRSKGLCNYRKGSDTLESFLSKLAFENDFRKKSCSCVMNTIAAFLLSK